MTENEQIADCGDLYEGRAVRESVAVPPESAGEHLDAYAAKAFNLLESRKAARKAVKRGDLLLDGALAQANWLVRAGQCLELLTPSAPPPPVYDFKFRVLLEDEYLAVVEKPAGIPVSGNYVRTIERALLANISASRQPDALPWPRPVHRLDAPTGGLLLIAKTARAMVELSRQFQERTVHKRYRAIVSGRLEGGGRICEPLDGRRAETGYRVLEQSRSLHTDWLTTLELELFTGRTHQLRRHLAGLGHPILGDRQYALPGQLLRSKGLFLWALELDFDHPKTGERMRMRIDEPPKFATYRDREQRRWQRYQDSE
jgi:RluA family pseudouridine synthase